MNEQVVAVLHNHHARVSARDIRRRFGAAFSDAVLALAPGQWHGPVSSGYGVHLVYVHAVETAAAPVLDTVRDRVVQDWRAQQQQEFNAAFLARLKQDYVIEIATLPLDRVLDGRAEAKVGTDAAAQNEPSS